MVDTTCPNARKLHYARANFKNNFDITNIDTESAPLLDYKAPGAFGEKGDNRQYAFLMYVNPNREEITSLKMPDEDENFDIDQFQDDNGLKDAMAGVGMVVKLGGEANCGGDDANELPSSLPTLGSTTAVGTGSTLSAQSTTTNTETSVSLVPSPTAGASNGTNDSAPSGGASNSTVAVSSVSQSGVLAPSTIISTPVQSSAGADSPTETVGLPEQSANAAPGWSRSQSWTLAPLLVGVGGLVW
jgi:hypothetical protein